MSDAPKSWVFLESHCPKQRALSHLAMDLVAKVIRRRDLRLQLQSRARPYLEWYAPGLSFQYTLSPAKFLCWDTTHLSPDTQKVNIETWGR
jgi:hypothetical protein